METINLNNAVITLNVAADGSPVLSCDNEAVFNEVKYHVDACKRFLIEQLCEFIDDKYAVDATAYIDRVDMLETTEFTNWLTKVACEVVFDYLTDYPEELENHSDYCDGMFDYVRDQDEFYEYAYKIGKSILSLAKQELYADKGELLRVMRIAARNFLIVATDCYGFEYPHAYDLQTVFNELIDAAINYNGDLYGDITSEELLNFLSIWFDREHKLLDDDDSEYDEACFKAVRSCAIHPFDVFTFMSNDDC